MRSRSSRRCARSSSSAEVNTFLFKLLSKRRCLRMEMSEAVSELPSSLSLLSLLLSWSCRNFFRGRRRQSVWQEILITRAARVRTSPMHTPDTKYRAARSGFSGGGGKREHVREDNSICRERIGLHSNLPAHLSPDPKALMATNRAFPYDKLHNVLKNTIIHKW